MRNNSDIIIDQLMARAVHGTGGITAIQAAAGRHCNQQTRDPLLDQCWANIDPTPGSCLRWINAGAASQMLDQHWTIAAPGYVGGPGQMVALPDHQPVSQCASSNQIIIFYRKNTFEYGNRMGCTLEPRAGRPA